MISVHNPQPFTERELQLTRALREFDPDAEVWIENGGGKLSVSTVLDEFEVIAILGGIGVDAAPKRAPVDDDQTSSGGENCGCGCGCG